MLVRMGDFPARRRMSQVLDILRETGAARFDRAKACASAFAVFVSVAALGFGFSACETVDPGPNFVVADERFDADYFFCKVEPEVLFAKKCGPGDPAAGDRANGCHFNASAVSGMALLQHPPVDCGGGERPLSRAQIGAGSPAQANLESASIVMSRDYTAAPIFVRPTGANHPRAIFPKNDPAADILRTWAQK